MRHDGVGEADYIDSMSKQALCESRGELCIAQHDRDDRVLSGDEIETDGGYALAEVSGVRPELLT